MKCWIEMKWWKIGSDLVLFHFLLVDRYVYLGLLWACINHHQAFFRYVHNHTVEFRVLLLCLSSNQESVSECISSIEFSHQPLWWCLWWQRQSPPRPHRFLLNTFPNTWPGTSPLLASNHQWSGHPPTTLYKLKKKTVYACLLIMVVQNLLSCLEEEERELFRILLIMFAMMFTYCTDLLVTYAASFAQNSH